MDLGETSIVTLLLSRNRVSLTANRGNDGKTVNSSIISDGSRVIDKTGMYDSSAKNPPTYLREDFEAILCTYGFSIIPVVAELRTEDRRNGGEGSPVREMFEIVDPVVANEGETIAITYTVKSKRPSTLSLVRVRSFFDIKSLALKRRVTEYKAEMEWKEALEETVLSFDWDPTISESEFRN